MSSLCGLTPGCCVQLHHERLSAIDRDNRRLTSKVADIFGSKGLVDHQNQYHLRSCYIQGHEVSRMTWGRHPWPSCVSDGRQCAVRGKLSKYASIRVWLLIFPPSLNADRRREELLSISRQNQAIYHRITSRQSEYRHQLWLDDWERAERWREDISRYPRGPAEKQRSCRKVKFAAAEDGERSTSCSNTSTNRS
ncbi:hypothetical protein Q8A73_023322 [Channa argus]|nr:hypothetical protein Q8A73_023322 [Channa argus]